MFKFYITYNTILYIYYIAVCGNNWIGNYNDAYSLYRETISSQSFNITLCYYSNVIDQLKPKIQFSMNKI